MRVWPVDHRSASRPGCSCGSWRHGAARGAVGVFAWLLLVALVAVPGAAAGCASTATSPATSTATATATWTTPAPAAATTAAPLADPPLQRPTLHLSITREGLAALLDALVDRRDSGSFALLGARTWSWERGPFALALDDAQKSVAVTTEVRATVAVPGATLTVPLQVQASVQPVLSTQHRLVLQAVRVRVTSDDRRVRFADVVAGLVGHVETALRERLMSLQVDLAPAWQGLASQLSTPIALPLAGASACFALDVRAVEAGPTILADGLEKQLALTVAPSLTLPCAAPPARGDGGDAAGTPSLPPLQNASAIEGGPFRLQVPVAATYDELGRAVRGAFPGGRLHFSSEHPGLFASDPAVFAADGALVVRVHLGGFVQGVVAGHGRVDVDGDLYVTGRPVVRDNFIEVADLRPTLESEQALLRLALALKHDALVQALQRALRLDLSARLAGARAKLVDALTVQRTLVEGVGPLCTRVDLGRLAVDEIAVHEPYLRATVSTTARLAAQLPCPGSAAMVSRPAADATVDAAGTAGPTGTAPPPTTTAPPPTTTAPPPTTTAPPPATTTTTTTTTTATTGTTETPPAPGE
jgi:hypothetical protein